MRRLRLAAVAAAVLAASTISASAVAAAVPATGSGPSVHHHASQIQHAERQTSNDHEDRWDGFALIDPTQDTWTFTYDNPSMGTHIFDFNADFSTKAEEQKSKDMMLSWMVEMTKLGYRFVPDEPATAGDAESVVYRWAKTTVRESHYEWFGHATITQEPGHLNVEFYGKGHPRPC